MELYQLKYFDTVANYDNISKAAKELHVAQPSISRAIGLLEQELEVTLFDRNGKKILLNAAGRELQKRLRPVLVALENIDRDLAALNSEAHKSIRLNMFVAQCFLPDILVKFRKQHSNVNFQITATRALDSYDLYVCGTTPDIYLENAVLLLNEEIFLAVPMGSPLSFSNEIDLNELTDENFILLSPGRTLRVISDRFFESLGFAPNISLESDSFYNVRELVSAGLGVTFWPEVSWGAIPEDKIKLLHIKSIIFRRNLFVVWPENSVLSEASLLFVQFLKDYFQNSKRLSP